MTGEGRAGAARLLAAAAADPAVAADLDRTYRGRHDVLDALWWRAHPGTAAPSGALDPAASLTDLERRAYRRGTSRADGDALLAARSQHGVDEAELDAAIAALAGAVGPREEPAEQAADARSRPVIGTREPTVGARTDDLVPVRTPSDASTRRRRILAWGAVAAIVGLAVSTTVLARRVGAYQDQVEPGPVTGEPDPLARFSVEQNDADLIDGPLPRGYDAASLRRLVRDEPGLLTDYALFGARTDDDGICLLLVFPDDEIASSCVSVPEFRRTGVQVSSNVLRPSTDSVGVSVPAAYTVTWQPDDSLSFASSPGSTR